MLPSLPGYWRPVPPANAAATFTHYAEVAPFAIRDARQFLPEPPPALTSQRYSEDFNEVKAIGGVNSATRTADQTLVARLFAPIATITTTSIPAVWNNLTRDMIRSRNLNDLEAARLYALMSTTFHDALYVSFSAKFLYGLWRPVTAVREAASDGNPATDPDPEFVSLIPTPPYPTYPGNYACLAGAVTRMFTRYFGRDDIPFSITWAEPAGSGITRAYNGFRQLADEAARSRVYGGIHFNFDTTSSFGVCIPLGDYIFENTFRPRFAQ
jgi:PAP2 superfamily